MGLQNQWRSDTLYLNLVGDLLANVKFRQLDDITHHHYTTRLKHSIYVSYVSYKIAKRLKLNVRSIARAGLLHDFFLEDRQAIAAMNQGSHNAVHPKLALNNARQITEVSPLEEDIILKHMFLCALCGVPRYQESIVVTCVDKYCALMEVSIPLRLSMKRIVQNCKATIATALCKHDG